MKNKQVKYLTVQTKAYFNQKADSFSASRHQLWPELIKLKKYINKGDKVLDLGSGNGRLFELFQGQSVKYFGLDYSVNLVRQAQQRYGLFFREGDLLDIPWPDNYFDSVWLIAVLPHLPSAEGRERALLEARRVLKPGGRMIIVCWNLYQWRYLRILFKFTLRKLLGMDLDFGDIWLATKDGKNKRYYHAFTKKGLKKLLLKTDLKIEKLSYLTRKDRAVNLLAIVSKCAILKK